MYLNFIFLWIMQHEPEVYQSLIKLQSSQDFLEHYIFPFKQLFFYKGLKQS